MDGEVCWACGASTGPLASQPVPGYGDQILCVDRVECRKRIWEELSNSPRPARRTGSGKPNEKASRR